MITTEGHFTPEMIAYLEEKALGGAGVVTYGEAIVHSATGKSHNKQLQLDSFGVKQGMAEASSDQDCVSSSARPRVLDAVIMYDGRSYT